MCEANIEHATDVATHKADVANNRFILEIQYPTIPNGLVTLLHYFTHTWFGSHGN